MSVRMFLTLLLCLSWGSPTMAQHRVQLHPTGTVSQRTLLQVQNGTMELQTTLHSRYPSYIALVSYVSRLTVVGLF